MKILLIGGTRFFGRRVLEVAVSHGHEVTVFHRGHTPLSGGLEVDEVLGDRNLDIERLEGEWDVAIDMCGYLPESLEISTSHLRPRVGKYVFISSISAYADFSDSHYDESTKLVRLTAEDEEFVRSIDPVKNIDATTLAEHYGGAKVLCEGIVQDRFGEDALIVRPGLIVGKFDHTDRFTYWVMRIADGGKVLVPGDPEMSVQFIDASDLARWLIGAVERDVVGEIQVTGKPGEVTFENMVSTIKSVTDSDAEFVWVDEQFLKEKGVRAWSDLPVFLYSDGEIAGMRLASIDRAIETGLVLSPLSKTVKELWEWRSLDKTKVSTGLARSEESAIIGEWEENTNDYEGS